MTGSSPSLRPIRALSLLLALLAGPALRAPADEPPPPPALTDVQKERLKERDRLWERASELYAAGKVSEAIELATAKHGIEVEVLGEASDEALGTLELIAIAHESRDDWPAATATRRRVLALRTASLGVDHWKSVDARVAAERGATLGRLDLEERRRWADATRLHAEFLRSFQAGHYDQALRQARLILDARTRLLGERHPDVAQSRNCVAVALGVQGRHAEALEEHRKALEIKVAALGERHPDVAKSRSNVARVLRDLGRHAEALEELGRALEIEVAALGERHPDVAGGRNNIALVLGDLGRHAEAFDSLNQALGALTVGEDSPEQSSARLDIGRLRLLPLTVTVLAGRGRLRSVNAAALRPALADLRAAAAVLDRLRARVHTAAESKLKAGEDAAELASTTVGVAGRLAEREHDPKALATALEAAEEGAARVFLEGLGRARARGLGGVPKKVLSEEDRKIAELNALDQQVNRLQNVPIEKRDTNAVTRLMERQRRVEAELRELAARMEKEYPQYAALKYPRPCSLAEAQACLVGNEVGLLYVLGNSWSYLIVLGKEGDPWVHELPTAGEIGEKVEALLAPKVLDDEDAARERGAELYRMLLGPAEGAIRGKGLVIVPSRATGRLPFEMLVEPGEAGRWLVEGHRIRYAPSLTALHMIGRWEKARERPGRALWALGDPAYREEGEKGIVVATRDRGSFGRLAGTRAEVERLREKLGGDARLGEEATEGAVKRLSEEGELAKYRYVHFACHGVLGTADGVQPALVLAEAGANGKEDGLLMLDEVTRLKLNADLVVLSACRTGEGRQYAAEGVSGLARAFLYAGSRGVVCSLWRVDDAATADLMADLYDGLADGTSAAEALRSAQLRSIAAGAPPSHWAPFVLIGR